MKIIITTLTTTERKVGMGAYGYQPQAQPKTNNKTVADSSRTKSAEEVVRIAR